MITLSPLRYEPCEFNVDDVVRYEPYVNRPEYRKLTPADSDSVGQLMRVVEVRDTLKNPCRSKSEYRTIRSRYLLTCVRPDGQHRAFYHVHAVKVQA
jgi:hypothetical protein